MVSHTYILPGMSATTPSEINGLLLKLAPLASVTPIALTQILAGKSSGRIGRMYQSVPSTFIRESCIALPKWSGPTILPPQLFRIHGEKDLVIPCPQECHVVKGAGHLVAYTHEEECVAWFRTVGNNADNTRNTNIENL